MGPAALCFPPLVSKEIVFVIVAEDRLWIVQRPLQSRGDAREGLHPRDKARKMVKVVPNVSRKEDDLIKVLVRDV